MIGLPLVGGPQESSALPVPSNLFATRRRGAKGVKKSNVMKRKGKRMKKLLQFTMLGAILALVTSPVAIYAQGTPILNTDVT